MSRTESIDVWLSVRTNCVMANLSGAETGPIWGSLTSSWADNFADFFGIWSDWFLGLAAALLYSELSSEVEGGRSSEHEWRAFWWRNGCLGRFLWMNSTTWVFDGDLLVLVTYVYVHNLEPAKCLKIWKGVISEWCVMPLPVSWWAGWALADSKFGNSVKPIPVSVDLRVSRIT